jgi:hypothetical protein
MYEVIFKQTKESMYKSETIRDCLTWIRYGEKESWNDFYVVDEEGKPVEMWRLK